MIESILIKNTDIVFPHTTKRGDVFIKNGKIDQIDWSINKSAELTINEPGLTLMAGIIDPHVHLRDPGVTHKEDLESGSFAAAEGGITSFFDMPNTKPSTTTQALMAQKKAIAAQKSIVNYNFFIGATTENLEELNAVENVAGIKIYVGSSTGSLLVDEDGPLEAIFAQGNKVIAVHSEDETTIQKNKEKYADSTTPADHEKIRSPEAAIICTKRLVKLALKYNRRLHICHVTTQEEAEFLAQYMDSCVTSEVCPQHLFLFGDAYEKLGTYAQINPPIRSDRRHADALYKALKNNVFSCMGTDHAPHTIEEKEQAFGKAPSGMPGLGTYLPLMLNEVHHGRLTPQQLTRWMSLGPAQTYGIKNKGKIEEDWDADFVLVDLKKTQKVDAKKQRSKAKWSAFDGWSLTGWPIMTIVNGQMVYREGDIFSEIKGKEIKIIP